jgi:hypothetical protein
LAGESIPRCRGQSTEKALIYATFSTLAISNGGEYT